MLKVGEKFTTEFSRSLCASRRTTSKQRLAFKPNSGWTEPKWAFAEVDALIISEPSAAELAMKQAKSTPR